MENTFSDDLNTIRADDIAEANAQLAEMEENDNPEGFENLDTPEAIEEYEAWLDESMDGDHESALESVYGPND